MKRIKWNPPTTGRTLYLSGKNYLKGDVLEVSDDFEHPYAEEFAVIEPTVFDLVEQSLVETHKTKRKPRKTT